jgi:hypothetical protein
MQTSFDIPKSLADELSRAVSAFKDALSTAPSMALPVALSESVAHVDLALADLIDLDAASFRASGSSTLSATATLTRYLDALHAYGIDSAPIARHFASTLEAAILAALHAPHGSPEFATERNVEDAQGHNSSGTARSSSSIQDRAFALALEFPALRDDILAVALAFGIPEEVPTALEVGTLVFGRWRIESLLGNGATAQVAIARDELLSTATASVEVVIKRFDDREGAARAHALRELRAIVSAPAGISPQPLALHRAQRRISSFAQSLRARRAAPTTSPLRPKHSSNSMLRASHMAISSPRTSAFDQTAASSSSTLAAQPTRLPRPRAPTLSAWQKLRDRSFRRSQAPPHVPHLRAAKPPSRAMRCTHSRPASSVDARANS